MKKNIYTFLICVLCYFALAILRGQHYERVYGDMASAIAGFVGLYALTYVLLRWNKGEKTIWTLSAMLLGISIVELPLRIFYNEAMGTLLTYAYWCSGIAGGYVLWRTNKLWKIIVLLVSLCIVCTIPRYIIACYGNNPGTENNPTEIVRP